MLKYRELIAGLKQGRVLPLYLFFGDEEFLIQEAVDLIIEKAVDPGGRDFNFATVYCRETGAVELVNLCQTFPFLSERRLVIAREIEAYKADDIETLTGYLKDPSPYTCLVLVSHQGRFEKKQVTAAVEAKGAVTRFFSLLDGEMLPWIEGRARSRGLTIRPDAANYLWQFLGNDLQKIANELEKVAIFLKDKKEISLDAVKHVVGDFREYLSFDLAEAIGRKDHDRSILILSRLIQEGEQPVVLLGSIAWNFRRLMRAKGMEATGKGYEEIKRKLGVIFHQSARFQEQMRRFTLEELRGVFSVLLAADRQLKSSALSGRLVLERMIMRVCGGEYGAWSMEHRA